jgi:hypothetical protein
MLAPVGSGGCAPAALSSVATTTCSGSTACPLSCQSGAFESGETVDKSSIWARGTSAARVGCFTESSHASSSPEAAFSVSGAERSERPSAPTAKTMLSDKSSHPRGAGEDALAPSVENMFAAQVLPLPKASGSVPTGQTQTSTNGNSRAGDICTSLAGGDGNVAAAGSSAWSDPPLSCNKASGSPPWGNSHNSNVDWARHAASLAIAMAGVARPPAAGPAAR